MKDENDKLRAGELPATPLADAKPANAKAKDKADEAARLCTVQGIMRASFDEAVAKKTTKNIITTCHYEIDRDTGGFCPEDVWVIAGKSQYGKTSYSIAVADENLKRGHRPLIVSGEDRPSLYGQRFMLRRTKINRYRYANGMMTSDEYAVATQALTQAENLPVYLDARGKSVEWAAKRVKQLVAAEGINIIFWDYLQCFQKESATQDQRLGITYIARVMTDTIKTCGKAGAILSQVTPDDKAMIPDMYSIRDSKDVANAAEVVAIGFFPKSSIERDVDGHKTLIAVEGERAMVLAKNKPGPGPGGRIYRMGSDPNVGCFDVVEDPMKVVEDSYWDTPPHWQDDRWTG